MREFRAPASTSVLRIVLAVVISAIVLGPTFVLTRVAFGMSQTTYRIADGVLTVHSGEAFASDRRIALSTLTEVRQVDLVGGRRTSGTALRGFCAGHYSYANLGAVWQATDCSRRVLLLRTSSDVVLISPADPEGFASQLMGAEPAFVALPPPQTGPLGVIAVVSVPVALVMTAMLVALMLVGPQRMRYRVGDGLLEVRTLFGRKRWALAGATAREHVPARLFRVAGSAMPGYFTGLFREGGQSTRVYATRIDRGVLFEGAARVFLSPEDPAGFLAALAREGATVGAVGGA